MQGGGHARIREGACRLNSCHHLLQIRGMQVGPDHCRQSAMTLKLFLYHHIRQKRDEATTTIGVHACAFDHATIHIGQPPQDIVTVLHSCCHACESSATRRWCQVTSTARLNVSAADRRAFPLKIYRHRRCPPLSAYGSDVGGRG